MTKMKNELVITPSLFKEQLSVRIANMVKRCRGNEFTFETPIDMMGEFAYGLSYDTSEKKLYLAIGSDGAVVHKSLYDDESEVEFYDASDFFIEQLWDAYLACEPIYEQTLRDYATVSE